MVLKKKKFFYLKNITREKIKIIEKLNFINLSSKKKTNGNVFYRRKHFFSKI